MAPIHIQVRLTIDDIQHRTSRERKHTTEKQEVKAVRGMGMVNNTLEVKGRRLGGGLGKQGGMGRQDDKLGDGMVEVRGEEDESSQATSKNQMKRRRH